MQRPAENPCWDCDGDCRGTECEHFPDEPDDRHRGRTLRSRWD